MIDEGNLLTKEEAMKTYLTIKDGEKLIDKHTDEYFIRLEKLYAGDRTAKTIKFSVLVISLTALVMFYLHLYFTTPYLTKNYVENGSGNVYQDVNNINGDVGGEE
jgi:hypothetical protein